ncbi:MAG: hypothetical protein QOF49_1323, partial [Chloroflexota bacterium]|nr:hypothetical protein [Chloroflexota bacterium]
SEADAELAAIAAYRDAAAARPAEPTLVERVGLWRSDPDTTLGSSAAAFREGDLRATVEAAAFARTTWLTAGDIGRNRVVAVVASVAAIVLALWLVLRWLHDRSARRRPAVVTNIGEG